MRKNVFILIIFMLVFGMMGCKENSESKPKVCIAFDLQGKGSTIDTIYVEEGALIIEPMEPTDEYYVFGGWFKEPACENQWNFETDKVVQNMTLYAKWETIGLCTVIFVTQKSGITVPKDTVETGSLLVAPSEPECDDYYFEGWYKEKACTNSWDFDTDRVLNSTTRLYAKWSQKYSYYGAELFSKETFTYGRFEARMKMAYAPGCISSMFLYYNNSDVSGSNLWNEIDIEVIGKDSLKFQSNIITGSRNSKKTSEKYHQPGTPLNTEYHTFVIEWTPEYVVWLVDGVEMRREETNENGTDQVTALIKDQSLRFNLWASSSTSWVGQMTHVNIPIAQYIDYIAVSDYNMETKEFTERWRDDFDGSTLNSSRWDRGNWQMDLVRERTSNVVVEDGNLVLKLTKELRARN